MKIITKKNIDIYFFFLKSLQKTAVFFHSMNKLIKCDWKNCFILRDSRLKIGVITNLIVQTS